LGETKVQAIFTPCHTQGHLCFMASNKQESVVFTGDFLFMGGTGKFFEGNAE